MGWIVHIRACLERRTVVDYEDLDELVDQFASEATGFSSATDDWPYIWDLMREIRERFRKTYYPSREDKDAAWARFAEARDELSAVRERIEEESASTLEDIERLAQQARPPCDLQQLFDGFVDGAIGYSDREYLGKWREELSDYNEALATAKDEFHRRKDEMIPKDRKAAYEAIEDVKEAIDQEWERYREYKDNL